MVQLGQQRHVISKEVSQVTVELLRPKVCDKPWLISNMEILEVSRKMVSYYLFKQQLITNIESKGHSIIPQYGISFKS